jgi:hypothetical protein
MLGVRAFQKISFNFSGRVVSSVTGTNNIKSRLMPIIFGAITFFVPCGFTLIAQAQALESGNFFRGLSVLTAFALGTLPVLLLISFSSLKFHKDPKFANSFRLLSGLLIIFFALFTLNSQLGILQLPSIGSVKAQIAEVPLTAPEINSEITPSVEQAVQVSDQVMQMEVKGEYSQKLSWSPAPTKFEITDNGRLVVPERFMLAVIFRCHLLEPIELSGICCT